MFDLLHLDGQDLRTAPLLERKRALAALMAELPESGLVRLSEHFAEDGPTMLKHAENMHLEGIVSKRTDAPYRSGRTADWLKVKTAIRNSSSSATALRQAWPADPLAPARLLRQGRQRYAGRIGTGQPEGGVRPATPTRGRKNSPLEKISRRSASEGSWSAIIVVEADFRLDWRQFIRQGS